MLSLGADFRSLAAFVLLLESVFGVCPQLRRQIEMEKRITNLISQFMRSNSDPNQVVSADEMTLLFKVPAEMMPVVFPTEPSLHIEELKIIDAVVNSSRKTCDFMVSHTNAEYTVQFHVVHEEALCYA